MISGEAAAPTLTETVAGGVPYTALFNPNSTGLLSNSTIPLPVRALHLIVKVESLFFRRIPALIFRISGLQALASGISHVFFGGPPIGGAAGPALAGEGQALKNAVLEALEAGNIRSLSGMFNFLFSRWAFACLAMV